MVVFLMGPMHVGAAHHTAVAELLEPEPVSCDPHIFPSVSVASPDVKPW